MLIWFDSLGGLGLGFALYLILSTFLSSVLVMFVCFNIKLVGGDGLCLLTFSALRTVICLLFKDWSYSGEGEGAYFLLAKEANFYEIELLLPVVY